MGIISQPLVGEDGIRIRTLLRKSPASLAGLRRGDAILKIDDNVLTRSQSFDETLSQYEIGDSVALTARRGDKEMKVKLTLADPAEYDPRDKRKNSDWVEILTERIATGKKERSGSEIDSGMLDIDIDMSKLESLVIRLDDAMSQQEQLQPFVGLPALKTAKITELSIEGAEFLLRTKEQWPEDMELIFKRDAFQ